MSARDEKIYALNVNGFPVDAQYDSQEEENVLDVIIGMLVSVRKRNGEKLKTIAFFSGPPGAGKSTLALSLCKRAKDIKSMFSFECLGLDGFHKTNHELERSFLEKDGYSICLKEIKGAPETFDAEAFFKTLEEVKFGKGRLWPQYDRRIHDVSRQRAEVTGDILLIEGNWLMLSGVWAQAREMCDVSFSIDEDDGLLKERLIDRKMRGGKTHAEATDWYNRVDGPNIFLYRSASASADFKIAHKNGRLSLSKKSKA